MEIFDSKVSFMHEAEMEAGYPLTDSEYPKIPKAIKRLARTDGGHNNFLSGIIVAFKIRYTAVWGQQFQRYHFAQIVSSQSKMHCLGKKDIDFKFSPYVSSVIVKVMETLKERYIEDPSEENFYRLVDSCPQGIELVMSVRTNYLQLRTIYHQRKHHKYYGWNIFCNYIENGLPKSYYITDK